MKILPFHEFIAMLKIKIFLDVIKLNSKYHDWIFFRHFEQSHENRRNLKILPFYEFLAMLRMKTFLDSIKLNKKQGNK